MKSPWDRFSKPKEVEQKAEVEKARQAVGEFKKEAAGTRIVVARLVARLDRLAAAYDRAEKILVHRERRDRGG